MPNPIPEDNLDIYEGQTYKKRFNVVDPNDQVTPVNISGYGAKMQIRLDLDDTTVDFELSTDNGMINVGDTYVDISIPHTFTFQGGFIGGYDLFVISPAGEYFPVVRGTVNIHDAFTQFS